MSFDAKKIMEEANSFSSTVFMNMIQDEPLTQDKVLILRSPEIFGTQYGKVIADNLIIGAILEYHEQLRKSLLAKGIDIGKFDEDKT